MARVFISHADLDLEIAVDLHRWLLQQGHEAFLDQDARDGIRIGADWQEKLHERLRWCDAVLCVVTAAFSASMWCAAEVAVAQSRGARILPALFQAGVTSPLLTQVQMLDMVEDETAARDRLDVELRALQGLGGPGWPDDCSPFPGLAAFQTTQYRAFFGRSADVDSLAQLLRSPAERAEGAALLIVGPSGCGKSSLLRAGLIPAMAAEQEWLTTSPVLPGARPMTALSRALAALATDLGLVWTATSIRHHLQRSATGLVDLTDELLDAAPDGQAHYLLLPVDQVEELLTQSAPAERQEFAAQLAAATDSSIRVVGTLRPEFLEPLLAHPDVSAVRTRLHPLRPLRREALREVIVGPAELAGLHVGAELVTRLVDDTDGGESLPLLAYTLAQLAEGVPRGGHLSTNRYAQLGGVGGALAKQADDALADALKSGRPREDVVRDLLRLVTVDEHLRPTRRRVLLADLPEPARASFHPFIGRRLLVTDHDMAIDPEPAADDRAEARSSAVITVAHEAFLSTWPPLTEGIAAAAAGLRARHRIEQAAADWYQAARDPDRLWNGGQLAAALSDLGWRPRRTPGFAAWRDTTPMITTRATRQTRGHIPEEQPPPSRVELGVHGQQFIQASSRREMRRRRRLTMVLSSLLVIVAVAAGVALVGQRDAEQGQRLATARQLVAQAQSLLDADPRTALQLGQAAYALNPGTEMRAALVGLLTATPYAGEIGHPASGVGSMAIAGDHRRMATISGGMAALWDITDSSELRRIGTVEPNLGAEIGLSPDGRVLTTSGGRGAVRLWDVADASAPVAVGSISGADLGLENSVAFSPDGRLLATYPASVTDPTAVGVVLWDVSDPRLPQRLNQSAITTARGAFTVAFAADGRLLATSGTDGWVSLWDISEPAEPRLVSQPVTTPDRNAANQFAFAPDAPILAITDGDSVVLWDVSDPARPAPRGQPLTGHDSSVTALAFAPDGRSLATADFNGVVMRWDLTVAADEQRQAPTDTLTAHTEEVSEMVFGADSTMLLTADEGSRGIVWDLTAPAASRAAGDGTRGSSTAAAFGADGVAVTADLDAVLYRDLNAPGEPLLLAHSLGSSEGIGIVDDIALASDGRRMVTSSQPVGLSFWDLVDPGRPTVVSHRSSGALGEQSLTFSPDNTTLATYENDRVSLWDLTDPAHPTRTGHIPGLRPLLSIQSAFSPDGRNLVIEDSRGGFATWDVTDPAVPRQVAEVAAENAQQSTAVTFSSDGRFLTTGSRGGAVTLWDMTDIARPQLLGQPLASHVEEVTALEFSPDGNTLASASADGTMVLWDLAEPESPRRLGSPLATGTGSVLALQFAADGGSVATAGADGRVIIWIAEQLGVARSDVLERSCGITQEGLGPIQWRQFVPDYDYQATCPY